MKPTNTTKVGTKLVDGGVVYEVYKILDEKLQDKEERIIHYRPYYKNINNTTLVCSVPESSLPNTALRPPVSKKDIDELFFYLSAKLKQNKELIIDDAESILYMNNIRDIAYVIKKFWKESVKKEVDFKKSKKDLLEKAILMITEEVALVTGTSLDTARKRITSALNKH
jgi:RNA polymerase-interacting CarD/CdnL/TRCF family regulator